ncbi:glomulin-like isoform X1 [Rhynchophorus ferrugineus]|uniref:glomulin-like isoform X1 n=1 Tax=Rhynchophorus ferrugineus TaxID=354439 RepID=UPI003FCCF7B7
MASEDINGFPKLLQLALREGRIDYSLSLIADEKYAQNIKNDSWDLIPVITEHFTEENKCNNNELYKCSATLLNIIIDHSNPEEALLQIISEIEESTENAKFFMLLDPLQKLINRISAKKVNSVAWSLNSIQTYLRQLDIPEYTNLEDKERLLIDFEKITTNIVTVYNEVLQFYSPFFNKITEETTHEIRLIFCKFLIQLLGEPLSSLSIHIIEDTKSEARIIAEDIVKKLFHLIEDPFIFSEMILEKKQDELIKPDSRSVAHLFYLIFSQKICVDNIPKVYSTIYIFHTSINLVLTLLGDSDLIVVEKALSLCYDVFFQLNGQVFSFYLLEYNCHNKFCDLLTKIMIYNQLDKIRKKALLVFEMYLKLFEIKGIYLIILNLVSIVEHGGLIGFMITFFKTLMNCEFNKVENNLNTYFKGPKLFNLLARFCLLKEKEETNLIDNSDQIISALNFLRYIALKDKSNVTKIWNFFPVLGETYFTPLRKALELSRAHYELEIKSTNETKLDECGNVSASVNVSGISLQKMDKDEKLKVLKSSLTIFDVIDSLLSRVVEIIK